VIPPPTLGIECPILGVDDRVRRGPRWETSTTCRVTVSVPQPLLVNDDSFVKGLRGREKRAVVGYFSTGSGETEEEPPWLGSEVAFAPNPSLEQMTEQVCVCMYAQTYTTFPLISVCRYIDMYRTSNLREILKRFVPGTDESLWK
jgi:hypothetical protein